MGLIYLLYFEVDVLCFAFRCCYLLTYGLVAYFRCLVLGTVLFADLVWVLCDVNLFCDCLVILLLLSFGLIYFVDFDCVTWFV